MQHKTLYCVVLFLSLTVGCAGDISAIDQARSDANTLVKNEQTTRAGIVSKLSTMPSTDPARTNLQSQLDKLDQLIAATQASLPKLDAAAKDPAPAPIDPAITQAAGAIPYGTLVVAVVGLVFGVVKHVQNGTLVDKQQEAEKAFEQIVGALDAALPSPTPDQQARVNAVLDTDVKAKVAAVRTA
jgi:hypothetical protein